jgi:tungstate transport system substrate-binding protein
MSPRRLFIPLLVAVLVAALAVPVVLPRGPEIVLATTTSTEDSGLLDYLLPQFTAETGIRVKVIAVGTGQALELGSRGDADVVLTHAPAKERTFLEEGHAAYRAEVMYNYFVLVGPTDDPANGTGINVYNALQHIALCRCTFVSRGDDSGTHTKELQLWRDAGRIPEPSAWYKESGQGMGATLRIADQLRAYTLSDDGTFFVMRDRLDLAVIVDNQPPLLNQYSVMPVNASTHPSVRFAQADAFAQWLIDPAKGQAFIAEFIVSGRQTFTPNASP